MLGGLFSSMKLLHVLGDSSIRRPLRAAVTLPSEMSKSRLRLMGAQSSPATMQCRGVEVQAGVGR